jgi:7-cyano-7-deazaguanine synthase
LKSEKKAIVLFSGGIDSTTTAAIALEQGFSITLFSFDYGQRHRVELEKCVRVAMQFSGASHIIFNLDLSKIGGSALTSAIEVPKLREIDDAIPITYVPGRNLIFFSIAAAYGEVHQTYNLFYGANILDYSGYPDCRPEFIHALETTLNCGTKAGSEGKAFIIHAPLLNLTKAEIIRKGLELGIDYSDTHSCYDPHPDGSSCGSCDSCVIRRKGFAEAGLEDPGLRSR